MSRSKASTARLARKRIVGSSMVVGGGVLVPFHLKSLSSARQFGHRVDGISACLVREGECVQGIETKTKK